MITVIVTILNPSILKSISVLGFEGRLESHSIIDKSINQVLIISKILLFFIIIKALKYKNNNKNNILGSYIISILNIIIYKGGNKKSVLMTGLASMNVLNKYYKDKIKITILVLFSTTVLTFGVINAYRSVNNSETFKLPELDAHRIQIYFSGPYNMALAVETKEMNSNIDIAYRMNDYLRPFLGIGSILRNIKYQLTDLFNERVSLGGPKGRSNNANKWARFIAFGFYFLYIHNFNTDNRV